MDKYFFRNNFPVESREESTNEFQTNISETRCKGQDYMTKKQIFDTFHFLIGHLIVYQPIDPIPYLYQLLDDCILFRAGLKEPRLLWMERHLDSIFRNLDIHNSGYVSLDSYKFAMKLLNIHSYNPCPAECIPGYVNRQTFCSEVMYSLEFVLARITDKTTC
ncbi:uncharacterized protein LOC143214920 [Lasioglossum baleicum]|uniref:uncharacterized protein LOC143214920 n=1 Tax=Lasioglossum baleicum TaxID=434251 RepID=UPI003FCCD224